MTRLVTYQEGQLSAAGAGLEQNHPVLLRRIVPMDQDVVTRHVSFEKPHDGLAVERSDAKSSKESRDVNRGHRRMG